MMRQTLFFRPILSLALLLILTSGARSIIADGPIPPDQWVKGEQAKRDGRTLMVDLPDQSDVGDLLYGFRQPLRLEPGVYRIRAVVTAEPVMNMAYRIVLTVRSDKPTESYTRWRPARTSQLTLRPKEIWHAVDEARAAQHNAEGQVELETVFAVTETHDYQAAVGWRMGEVHLGGRFLKWEQAPASLDRLRLISISCDRLQSNALLGELMTDKVVYKPGRSPVQLSTTITWTGKNPKRLTYRVRMSKDLEPASVVAEGEVTAAPQAITPMNIELEALKRFGGYRFDLDLYEDEKLIQTRERSAACSPRYNRIGISGVNHDEYLQSTPLATEISVRHAFDNMRDDYISRFETGISWFPDNFQNHTPKKEDYLSSAMVPMKRSGAKWITQVGHEYGISIDAYLKGNYADGRDGYEWAMKNPELILYHRDTAQPMGQYNMDHLLNWDDYADRVFNKNERVGKHWYYALLNAGRPSIVDISARETLASHKMFGWAGVRFDGDFDVWESETYFEGPMRDMKGNVTARPDDAEIVYANNILRYKRKIRKVLPDFEFGFNHALDDSHQRWIVGPAIASDESMVMNEPIRSFGNSPQQAYNRWEDYASMLTHYSRIVRSWGGYYLPIGCYGMRADDYLYQSVYTLAAQAKTVGPYYFNSPFTRRLSRFVTRYAGIMCGTQYPVPAAEGRVKVESSAPLQYRQYVNYMEPSEHQRDYIIQLINPPVPERAVSNDTRSLLRPPVTDVRVRLDTDDPYENPVKAWMLDPWFEDDAVEVPLEIDADGVTAILPRPVSIWSVVVIRCDIKGLRP